MFGSRWFLWAVHLETGVLESYRSSADLLICPALVFSSVKWNSADETRVV